MHWYFMRMCACMYAGRCRNESVNSHTPHVGTATYHHPRPPPPPYRLLVGMLGPNVAPRSFACHKRSISPISLMVHMWNNVRTTLNVHLCTYAFYRSRDFRIFASALFTRHLVTCRGWPGRKAAVWVQVGAVGSGRRRQVNQAEELLCRGTCCVRHVDLLPIPTSCSCNNRRM